MNRRFTCFIINEFDEKYLGVVSKEPLFYVHQIMEHVVVQVERACYGNESIVVAEFRSLPGSPELEVVVRDCKVAFVDIAGDDDVLDTAARRLAARYDAPLRVS